MRDAILQFLKQQGNLRRGTIISSQECRLLLESLSCDASHLCVLMSLCPLAGVRFCREEPEDARFDFEWLDAKSIVEEAVELYPGIAAMKEGYIPVGSDLVGTGDPYFIRSSEYGDQALYQISHELADEDSESLLPGAVTIVLPKLEMLLDFVA